MSNKGSQTAIGGEIPSVKPEFSTHRGSHPESKANYISELIERALDPTQQNQTPTQYITMRVQQGYTVTARYPITAEGTRNLEEHTDRLRKKYGMLSGKYEVVVDSVSVGQNRKIQINWDDHEGSYVVLEKNEDKI